MSSRTASLSWDLRVEEVRDESLGRYVRMARVVDRQRTGRGP